MQIWQTSNTVKPDAPQYVDIHDDGYFYDRGLFITDDDGNTVVLKNEQIGRLYDGIKPPLAG